MRVSRANSALHLRPRRESERQPWRGGARANESESASIKVVETSSHVERGRSTLSRMLVLFRSIYFSPSIKFPSVQPYGDMIFVLTPEHDTRSLVNTSSFGGIPIARENIDSCKIHRFRSVCEASDFFFDTSLVLFGDKTEN